MKLAFAILAHKYPEEIVRLVNTLSSAGDAIFIHIDQRATPVFDELKQRLGHRSQVSFTDQRYPCRWGQFSIVNATLSCLRDICRQKDQYDYVCLLSGQDYPIKPLPAIKRFLADRQGQQFIEAFPLLEPNKWSEATGAYQALHRILHWHFFVRGRHFYLPLPRQLPNALIPYGGSQWWTLTGDCVQWIVDYVDLYPAVADYFRYAFIPDESFFQILVCNSPFKRDVTGHSLSYVDWSNPNPTPPRVLTVEDFASLKESDCCFARKFDPFRSKELQAMVEQIWR